MTLVNDCCTGEPNTEVTVCALLGHALPPSDRTPVPDSGREKPTVAHFGELKSSASLRIPAVQICISSCMLSVSSAINTRSCANTRAGGTHDTSSSLSSWRRKKPSPDSCSRCSTSAHTACTEAVRGSSPVRAYGLHPPTGLLLILPRFCVPCTASES